MTRKTKLPAQVLELARANLLAKPAAKSPELVKAAKASTKPVKTTKLKVIAALKKLHPMD